MLKINSPNIVQKILIQDHLGHMQLIGLGAWFQF
jgi:hypothetical protein